ncbi:LPXTG cell wall anchor domain-containing protein [Streptomyces sp. SID8369]|nr:LPXTG cell wall anchor domain-containing protein [Streptomyces sp. SID8369]
MAAAVVGLTGGVISAGPAAAHTPTWAVTCSEVTVDLTNYTAGVPNTVTVTVDGKDLLPTETFGREFHKKLTLPEHDEPVTVRLVVKDAEGDGKYSIDKTETAEVCEKPSPTPPTPTQPAPSETTGTPEPSATPSEEPSESAPAVPAPSPSSPNLAETGSSSSTPVIGGAAVAVLLAGGGIMWSVRKRRTAQN